MKHLLEFKNLIELINYFKDSKELALAHLEELRWAGKPHCPHCGSERIYTFKNSHTYKCANNACYKKFTATVGTIYENTKIPLYKWFAAIYVCANHKKGISSCQLAKDISITQKAAWFVLHRIREMLKENNPTLLEGTVEVDETFVGGRLKNKHEWQRQKYSAEGTSTTTANKTMVFTALERGTGKIHNQIVTGTNGAMLQPIIRKNVKAGSTIYSDENRAYKGLNKDYTHKSVSHQIGNFVRGEIHSNTVEGYFSHLKRGIVGIYHHVSPKHLLSYCNEFSFRYETRKFTEVDRYSVVIKQGCGRRLTYNKLVGK